MINNKKIGVVVLNYNDSKTTIELLNLIKNYVVIDKIVVVDNASTDDSYNILKVYENQKIKVIQSNKNGGYSYGNNFGAFWLIEKYNVDILFIASPDVEFGEEFVKKISTLIINKDIACASGRMNENGGNFNINGNFISDRIYLENLLATTILGAKIRHLYYKPNNKTYTGIIYVDMITGPLFAIKADVLKKIKGFDDGVFLYCEELILGTRLKRAGYKTAIDTDISFFHKGSVTINKNLNYLKKVRQMFNSRLYYFKNYSDINALQYFILKLFIEYGYFARKILFKIYRLIKA